MFPLAPLLVVDTEKDVIAKILQLVAGRISQEFNQRKKKKGAFWEDRDHTTAVEETDEHRAKGIAFVNLNMVRTGVIKHPSEYRTSGFNEIQNPPGRYTVITRRRPVSMRSHTHHNLYLKRIFWISSILTVLLMFIGSRSEGRDAGPPQGLNHSGQIRAVIDEKKTMRTPLFPIRLPQKFDLREYNRVATPHKTTGCASCWSSTATYIMESMLMPKEDVDLSETHMQMSQLHKCGTGAAAEYAAYYLTSWRGPITENDYQHLVLKNGGKARKKAHVQHVTFIPFRQGPLDNQLIKQFIYYNGPVYASVGWRGMTNAVNQAYYWPGNSAVHAVALLGWDDHFSKNKFTYSIQGTTFTPAGDGAFIARNNDGTFYYLSYYDGTLGYNSMATFDAETVTNYKRIYQHDLYGPRNYIGPSDIPDNPPDSNYVPAIFGANVFTALSDEKLAAVGFFTHPYPGRAETYDIAVYLDPDNIPINSSGPVATFSVKRPMGGYYTAALPHTVRLTSQQRFSIVVSGHETGKPVNTSHLSVEQKPFNDPLSVSPGESYISRDGLNWFDLTAVLGKNSSTGEQENIYGNLGIKAYTQELPNAPNSVLHKYPSYTLAVTEVNAPDINCRFDPTCNVAVHDTVTHFTLPEASGNAFLQSRTWPVGKKERQERGSQPICIGSTCVRWRE